MTLRRGFVGCSVHFRHFAVRAHDCGTLAECDRLTVLFRSCRRHLDVYIVEGKEEESQGLRKKM